MVDHHRDVLRAHGHHRLPVKKVIEETPDAKTFVLDLPDGLRAAFAYRPGQFCTFRLRVDGAEHLRSYSMSSAPEVDADLAVTVKRVPGGAVSNWFNDEVAPGHVLEVTRPAGVFCPRDTDGPVVAFCGGSGVTPVLSIAKSVLASAERRPVSIVYANRNRDSVIFADALARLVGAHPDRLQLHHHFDCDGGFLSREAVTAIVAPGADYYLCGPGPFMDLVEATLLTVGVDADRILIERFELAVAPPASVLVTPTETVTLVLKGRPTTVSYKAGDTVLETARRAGLAPPFSCEAGNCATCMAFVKEGTVRMRTNNALTPEELDEGWVLTCQSLPTSPTLTVEYESV